MNSRKFTLGLASVLVIVAITGFIIDEVKAEFRHKATAS